MKITRLTKALALQLTPGSIVFCTVHGPSLGPWTFREVRPRDGYIRIGHLRAWCPPHNFEIREEETHT